MACLLLSLIVVVSSLFSPQSILAGESPLESTVGTSSSPYAVGYNYQNKAWFIAGYHYVFYSDGTDMVYATSTDGTTFSASTTIATCSDGRDFDVWIDGTNVSYVRSDTSGDDELYYRSGSVVGDTISWDFAEKLIEAWPTLHYLERPTIVVSAIDEPWIGVRAREGALNCSFWAYTSSDAGDSWTNHTIQGWGTLLVGTQVEALENGNIYFVFGLGGNSALWGRLFDGSLQALEQITDANPYDLAESDGNTVFVFENNVSVLWVNSRIKKELFFRTRDNDTGSWGSISTFDTDEGGSDRLPSVTSFRSRDDFYFFRPSFDRYRIYYWTFNGTLGAKTELMYEADLLTNAGMPFGGQSAFPFPMSNMTGLAYLAKQSSLYDVQYVFLESSDLFDEEVETSVSVVLDGGLDTYDPEFGLNETWIFAGRTYTFDTSYFHSQGWEYLSLCMLQFSDGENWITLSYDNENGTISTDSGAGVIYITDFSVSNTTSYILALSWTFVLEEREILDALDVLVYSRVTESVLGLDSGWIGSSVSFHIYNQGGLTKYLFTGDAERILGGAPLDLRIGTDYVPADIFSDEFEDGFLSSSWDQWDNATSEIGVVNLWDELVIPRSGYTDPFGLEVTSPSGYPDNEYAWVRLYYPGFEYSAGSYVVEFYLQLNDNSSHYNWIDFEDALGSVKASIEFGYASDFFIYLYNQTGGSFINTTYGWEENTWFKVDVNFTCTDVGGSYSWDYEVFIDDVSIGTVTNAFTSAYGPVYQPQRIYFFSHGGLAQAKTMYIDSVLIWSDWAGGTGGTAIAKVHFVNLQAFHSDFKFKIPFGDADLSALTGDIPNNCYVEFTLEFINQTGIWEEGPTLRIMPIDGRSSGENQWVALWVQHIYNGATINATTIYCFWEGHGGDDKDFFRLWIDLWTSQINASSTYGLRTNAFYYGVQDVSNPWFRWLTGSNWGIMGQREDLGGGYGSYVNSSGSVISASVFPMSRIRVLLWREADMDFEVQVIGWSDVSYKRTGLNDPMTGIQTPIFHSPLMPNLPSGSWFMGLFFWLISGLQDLMVSFISLWESATLFFVYTIVPLIDAFLYWIYPDIGLNAFSTFVEGFSSLLSQFSSFVEYFIIMIGYVVQMLTQVMTFIAGIFTYVISLFIQVVDIGMQFINMVVSIFQGGYGVGVNIWTDWAGPSWITLAVVFYPVYLFQRCSVVGSFQPLEWHLTKWKDVFAFLFDIAHKLYNIVIGTIQFIIESIPVVE
jgi:hypothetical protein